MVTRIGSEMERNEEKAKENGSGVRGLEANIWTLASEAGKIKSHSPHAFSLPRDVTHNRPQSTSEVPENCDVTPQGKKRSSKDSFTRRY